VFVRRPYVCCTLVTDRLLLGLASTVILDSDSRGTQDHIWTDLEPGRSDPFFYVPSVSMGFIYTPRHWIPFLSPLRISGLRRRYSKPASRFLQDKSYKRTPWPQSASKLYRPSDRRLLTKLVPTFVARGWKVVSV
jgi:hypothetical protein